jgi:Tfp pilus assembly protein PilV
VLSFELKKKRKRSKNNDWTRIMAQKTNRRSGLTLVEMMLAAAILMVALVGSMAYRYYATLDARKADIQMTASRNAMMILESWRGAGGSDTFNVTTLQSSPSLLIADSSFTNPAVPTGFTALASHGTVSIHTDNVWYYVVLSTKPVVSGVTPKALNVQIGWRLDRTAGSLASTDKVIGFTTYIAD